MVDLAALTARNDGNAVHHLPGGRWPPGTRCSGSAPRMRSTPECGACLWPLGWPTSTWAVARPSASQTRSQAYSSDELRCWRGGALADLDRRRVYEVLAVVVQSAPIVQVWAAKACAVVRKRPTMTAVHPTPSVSLSHYRCPSIPRRFSCDRAGSGRSEGRGGCRWSAPTGAAP